MNNTVRTLSAPVAAALLAVTLAATACSDAEPRSAPVASAPSTSASQPPIATPTPTPTATPSPTPRPTTGPILTGERTIALGVRADVLVPAGPVVYALSSDGGTVTVVRVDVDANAVTTRRTFHADSARASVGGGRLAVLLSTRAAATIELLDLRTLAPLASRTFGTAADVLARPEATYVSTPGHILVLDPKSLRTVRTIRTDDPPREDPAGAQIAADPRSHILYAGVPNGTGNDEPKVDIIDLRTGRILARPAVPAVVVARPQGYGDDGWVVYATGNFASAELLGPAGRVLATIGPIGPNSSTIAVTGRHLWTFAPSFNSPACRNLRTGAVEGQASPAPTDDAVAADNTHVYLADGSTLAVFTPSGACA